MSAAASTAPLEEPVQDRTWEYKFKMLQEFQSSKITQGNITQLLYIWMRN
jgi:hypothetical protein